MRGRYGHGETHAKTLSRKIVAPFRIAGITAGLATKNHSFDYMLGGWSDADRLPTTPETLNAMRTLGAAMKDSIGASTPDGVIPAAYTYFGQFVDHDITFDEDSAPVSHLAEADLKPLSSLANLRNSRTAFVELDSVYFSDLPRDSNDQNKLKVGQMVLLNGEQLPFLRPSGKSDFNDLPRVGRSDDPRLDRAADIGDPRNDENIIVAQLHTAFLKAHNSLVQQGNDFDGARRKLILRYQSVLLDDYLARICDPEVYMKALQEGPSH
jgi:hypothetical protein